MGELEGLLDRVRAAMGPNRELDHEIALTLRSPGFRSQTYPEWAHRSGLSPSVMWSCLQYDAGGNPEKVSAYTSSIDAAVALVERCFPGWKWGVHPHAQAGLYRAHVTKSSPFRPMPNIGDAGTPPLAIVAALLSALIAQQPAQPDPTASAKGERE